MSFNIDIEGFGGGDADLQLFGNLTFEGMAKKALNEVRPDVEAGTRAAVRASVQHPGDSQLVNSVKTYEPVMTRNGEGAKLSCAFSGKSASGNRYHTVSRGHATTKAVRNSDKAFWLEYGVAGRQPARPWRDRALKNIESKITPKIEKSIDQQLGAE